MQKDINLQDISKIIFPMTKGDQKNPLNLATSAVAVLLTIFGLHRPRQSEPGESVYGATPARPYQCPPLSVLAAVTLPASLHSRQCVPSRRTGNIVMAQELTIEYVHQRSLMHMHACVHVHIYTHACEHAHIYPCVHEYAQHASRWRV